MRRGGERDHKMAGKPEHGGRDPKEDHDYEGIRKDELNGKEYELWLENEIDGKLCVETKR